MSKYFIRMMLITLVLVVGLATPLLGQEGNNEARKYFVRGMAAIEMAKTKAELENALVEFKKAIEIAPEMAVAWYNLGLVQVKVGQISEAIESYRKYLALAPQAENARMIDDEIIKLEYRLERDKIATMLNGTWTSTDGQEFKLQVEGSRLQLIQTVQRDFTCDIKALGTTYPNALNVPPLVFSGTLVGDKISGQYLQRGGNGSLQASAYCELPELKGNFEGTIDVFAGRMRIVYNRVKIAYLMQFKSLLSDKFVCRQTKRQDMPGYVLELTRIQK